MLKRQSEWIQGMALGMLIILAVIGAGSMHSHAAETVPQAPTVAPKTRNPYQEIWDGATSEEKALLVQILALEAQGEPYEGVKAACEVMLNRVASPEWPDTIYGVLSQPGQFTAWKYRNDPYNYPTIEEYHAVDDVITNGPQVLPEGYVYFATWKANGRGFIRIGHHWFSH
jgi:hypothetical protein